MKNRIIQSIYREIKSFDNKKNRDDYIKIAEKELLKDYQNKFLRILQAFDIFEGMGLSGLPYLVRIEIFDEYPLLPKDEGILHTIKKLGELNA